MQAQEPGSSPASFNRLTTQELKERYRQQMRPALGQTAINLRVWVPFFTNPFQRSTLVRFASEDERVGLSWKVALPRQCWQCGSTTGLSPVEFEESIRTLDNPVALLGGSIAAISLVLLLFLLMPGVYTFFLLFLVSAIALAVVMLKSWREDVRLTMFTCQDHRATARCPDMAIDDQKLHVFLPTAELASAAAAEIAARRKDHARKRGMGSEEPHSERSYAAPPPRLAPSPPASEEPIRLARPEPVDLPPIKLAGDDDDLPADQGK
jgi:hypothetical protein